MARNYRRRNYSRRRRENTVWQPYIQTWDQQNIPSKSFQHKLIDVVYPGIAKTGRTEDDYFEDQHVLERIRGTCLHNVDSGGGQTGQLVAVNMALFKVPAQLTESLSDADMPDLFKSGDGEDYPLFMSMICGVGADEPTSNLDVVDNKSKRKLDVGDAFALCLSYYNASTSTSLDLRIMLNLRFLWKLLT